jgi:Domain of unknown function (DUF4352)
MHDQKTAPALEFASPKDAPAQAMAQKARRKSPPWYKKKRFLLPSALTVLLVIILGANGGLGPDIYHAVLGDPQPTATQAAVPGPPFIGSAAEDGKFDFGVTGVKRPGKAMPGKNGTTLTAKGEFVVVMVNVTNIGTVGQSLDVRCQYLYNNKGTRYTPSPVILATKDALKFVQTIEPGQTVKGTDMLFDVAPGTKLGFIELHDTPDTAGVEVALS